MVYTREIVSVPRKFVKYGKPVFGIFSGTPEKIDIRGIRYPFAGIQLPSLITNFRIKSTASLEFSIGNYIGTLYFFDAKIYGFAEIVFWDKETNKKYTYRSFMGPRRRFIPHKIKIGYVASFRKSRYIRISWDREADKLSVIFNLQGDSVRPSVQGAFLAKYSDSIFNEITTSTPVYSKSRSSCTYTANIKINGSISIGETKFSPAISMQKTDGIAIFSLSRQYYNYLTKSENIYGEGELKGKKVTFRISMKQSEFDADNYNDNLLFVDGECTPLPPVLITHPSGVAEFENKWVIQDIENMVDLAFTPISNNARNMSFFFVKADSDSIFGTLSGALKTKDGESLELKEFPAVAKKILLRI